MKCTCFITLLDSNLSSPKQSGFRLGDSCVDQMLPINYKTFSAFDIGLVVLQLTLDISKAFDEI